MRPVEVVVALDGDAVGKQPSRPEDSFDLGTFHPKPNLARNSSRSLVATSSINGIVAWNRLLVNPMTSLYCSLSAGSPGRVSTPLTIS